MEVSNYQNLSPTDTIFLNSFFKKAPMLNLMVFIPLNPNEQIKILPSLPTRKLFRIPEDTNSENSPPKKKR